MLEPYALPAGESPPPAKPPRTRRRRLVLLLLSLVIGLPLLAGLATVAGLRSAAVRRALLARVSTYLDRELGLAFAAADFDFRLDGVELEGVRLGAPGAPPLLTAERLIALVDYGTLRSEVLVIRRLEVVAPRLDLAAPFPELPAAEPAAPPGFEIRRFVLRRGAIAGAPTAGAAAEWVRRWRVDGIEGGGSFAGGLWALRLDAARGQVERPGFAPLSPELAGRARWRDGQPLEITALRVDGGGFRLTGSGSVGLGAEQPTAVDFQVEAEPRLFAAGTPPGGVVRGEGTLRLPESTGRLALSAGAFPAEALRPYLDRELFAGLELAGTVADARATLVLGPGSLARIRGEATATWRRGSRRLARAAGSVEPGPEGAIRLIAEADLLPDSAGRRHVHGALAAASLAGLGEGTAERIAAELRAPDARAAWEELRSLWPRFVPAIPAGAPVQGEIAADVGLAGPLASPRAELAVSWAPAAGSRVRVEAEGFPRSGSGSAAADFEALPVALLGPLAGTPEGWAGTLSGRLDLSGSRAGLHARLDATGSELAAPAAAGMTATAERLQVVLDGDVGLAPLSWAGTYALDASGLDAPGTARAAAVRVDGDGRFAGSLATLAGTARLAGSTIEITAAGTTLDALALDAAVGGGELRLASFSAAAGERTLAGSGRLLLEPLLAEADLDLRLGGLHAALREAALTAALRDGTLSISALRIDSAAGLASLEATVPLAALRTIPQLASALDALPFAPAAGPVALRLRAPALDSAPLLAALALAPRPERLRAGLAADLTFDPGSPAAGHGEVRLEGLTVETPDARAAAEGPAVARLGGGRLELLPLRVRFAGAVEGAGVELSGRADLDPAWRPQDDPPAALVSRLALDAAGTLDAAVLNPYLAGGAGAGALSLTAAVSGSPDALAAEVRAEGPGASFFWPAPYATRIQEPEADLVLRDGRWRLERGSALWNGGALAASGGNRPEGGAALAFDLSGVRYRLDYGLSALLSGRLVLDLPAAGRSRLSGRLTLDRGLLDRNVNLDREVRALLFAPEDLPGTEESALAALDLDLAVDTVDGVRVRNNVADLRAWWQSLEVTGTPELPVVEGRIELDPGGLLFAYGQTVRIDSGALVFTGDPLIDPLVELTTTSSLQDPTIARLRGDESPFDLLDQPGATPASARARDALAAGLAGYYGTRALSRLGESVGLQRIALRPVLVFQETDPSARLDLGHDLSPHAAFALSIDLRNAERRTYLLDLHGFRELPGLALQGFVNDEGREGASLQQVLELGGGRPPAAAGPRLRRLRLEAPGGALRRRSLRRAVPLERGAPVPESAPFDVEVVLADALRRRGHPDPRIAVAVAPVEGRPGRVDVEVRVEPGPRAELVFAGDRLPSSIRREIAALYRTDFYESASIEEMKEEAVRAWRGRGHLDPRVEVEVEARPDGARTVTLRSAAGPRMELRELAFAGLDAEAAAVAAWRFAGTLARTELAAGLPGADRRLLETLRALGYPEAKVLGRTLEEGGKRLAVQVEPGARQVVASVALSGVGEDERRRLAALLPVAPGDPVRLDRIAEGALLLERALAAEGHPDAVVRPSVLPGAAASVRPLAMEVRYAVAPGPRLELAGVEFQGERWTRPARLQRIAGLETGGPFTAGAVEEARARLFRSGSFARVTAEVDRPGDGAARVRFSLAERPRFHLGYGIRWESTVGPAAVVDLVDANFLGRGLTLGLRGLYESDDRSGRLFLRTGAFSRAGLSLEAYAQGRRRLPEENFVEDSLETALQLARPLGARTTARLYARYRTTRLFEEEPDPFFPLEIEITHPYLGTQLLYDALDDPLDPADGLFASLDLSGSGPLVGSDFDYARMFGQLQLYRAVAPGGRRLVWAQSLRLGWAQAFGGQELLRFERFFAGGEHSVRGYPTEGLGPREVLGDLVRPLGGEALLVLNEELRVRLPWDLTGLVFLDAGQVWTDAADFGTDLATALGLGLRALTPIGLLRLDAAFPLDRRPGDESWRLYVGFGNAF